MENNYVCPTCKTPLTGNSVTLVCPRCRINYPIRNGIPDFILEDLAESEHQVLRSVSFIDKLAKIYESPIWYPLVYHIYGGLFIPSVKEEVEMITEMVDAQGGVGLDVACGTGLFTRSIARKMRHVYCIDISRGMLEEAARYAEKEELHNIRFARARLGKMDRVDMTVKHHTRSGKEKSKVWIAGTNNGFVGKAIRYIGKEAHAGGAPDKGTNALNAAMLGIMGIHSLRETFKDDDHIRVHPIVTRGGDLVNIIPADVRIETYVRGKTTDVILKASKKVNRALRGGALTVGAKVKIQEIPGYLPMKNDPEMSKIFGENAKKILGKRSVKKDEHRTGSTDTGDLSAIMPTIEPSISGATGTGHGNDYKIADKRMGYIVPAELMAMTVIDLLWDNATNAHKIIKTFKPQVKRKEYVRYWERLLR